MTRFAFISLLGAAFFLGGCFESKKKVVKKAAISESVSSLSVVSSPSSDSTCLLKRNGKEVTGYLCVATIVENSSCCSMDEGCVLSGRGKGQCFACADEGRDLLCGNKSAEYGFICCDSKSQTCGTKNQGCLNN